MAAAALAASVQNVDQLPNLNGSDLEQSPPPVPPPVIRDASGRFRPGSVPNPAGRPPGRHPITVLLDNIGAQNAAEVVETVSSRAKAGDMVAAGLLLQRVWPARKGRVGPPFKLPELTGADSVAQAMAATVGAVGAGLISTSEATELGNLIQMYAKAIELGAVEKRLARLESRLGWRGGAERLEPFDPDEGEEPEEDGEDEDGAEDEDEAAPEIEAAADQVA